MLGSDSISHHDFEESIDLLSKTNCNVVSMIGVLEHLQDPRSALKVIKDNKNIEYLSFHYLCLVYRFF